MWRLMVVSASDNKIHVHLWSFLGLGLLDQSGDTKVLVSLVTFTVCWQISEQKIESSCKLA